MPVPITQAARIASYILKQKMLGNDRYPLVLMLEPLFQCNLECAGCGKIQYPNHVLKRRLTPEQCFNAAEECGAPVVTVAGGEPLVHPQIKEIVEGLIDRKRFVYLCTNALLLKQKMDLFTPSTYLNLSVHLDGLGEDHDFSVCREGVYEAAVEAIKEGLRRGFRVTTNTTFFLGAEPPRAHAFFDELTRLGVEGMTISAGYNYAKAPDQQHFLHRQETMKLFTEILANNPNPKWVFNQSPLFLEFLMGRRFYECTPWGTISYNIFGWQRPCYLLEEGFAGSYRELMDETAWENYGSRSGNPKCANCMVHCGYEGSAVNDTFSSLDGFMQTVKLTLGGIRASRKLEDQDALYHPCCGAPKEAHKENGGCVCGKAAQKGN
ncbi:MAG: adenosyl-hopene transferase HpnH [Verrucomicrobiae bacterium]|nr:adenosyl-hopene transferase HpnH [Verrucomicrobiae bacterium]